MTGACDLFLPPPSFCASIMACLFCSASSNFFFFSSAGINHWALISLLAATLLLCFHHGLSLLFCLFQLFLLFFCGHQSLGLDFSSCRHPPFVLPSWLVSSVLPLPTFSSFLLPLWLSFRLPLYELSLPLPSFAGQVSFPALL